MSGDFETFFRESFAAVTGFLIRTGASVPEAEDAAQEAMVLAYRSWSTIRCPRAWVRLVAWRVHAASVVNSCEATGTLSGEESAAAANGDELVFLGEEERQVVALLRRLPAAQRVVMAWFYDGYRPSEIAVLLGKPAATVRSDLRFARMRLRRELAANPWVGDRWPEVDPVTVLKVHAADVNAARDGVVTGLELELNRADLKRNTLADGGEPPTGRWDREHGPPAGDAGTIKAEGDQR